MKTYCQLAICLYGGILALLLTCGPLHAQEPTKTVSVPERDGMLIPPGMDQFEQLVVDDVLSLIRDYRSATRSSLLHGPGFESSGPGSGGRMIIRRKVADVPGTIDECTVSGIDDRQYVYVKRHYPDGSMLIFDYEDGKCNSFIVATSKENGGIEINGFLSPYSTSSIGLLAPSAPGQVRDTAFYNKRWDKDWHASTVAGQTAMPLQAVRFYLKWREKWVKRPAELPKLPPEPKLAAPVTSYNWQEPWTKTAPPAETGK